MTPATPPNYIRISGWREEEKRRMPDPETHAVHVYDLKATISLLLDRFLQHELERVEITVSWPKEKNLSVDLGIQVWE